MLTHRGAGRVQDGLSLGVVHHHLLQALEILLRQLLPVPNEPGQAAVHRVVGHDLDELREVVAVPFAADTGRTSEHTGRRFPLRQERGIHSRMYRPTTEPRHTTADRAHVLGESSVPPVSIQPALQCAVCGKH